MEAEREDRAINPSLIQSVESFCVGVSNSGRIERKQKP